MSNTADDLKRKNNQAGSTAVNSKNNKASKKKGSKTKASVATKKQDAWKMGTSVSSKTPELVAVTKETVAKQEKEAAEIYKFPSEEVEKKPEIIIPAKTFSKETAEAKKEEPFTMSTDTPETKIEVTAATDSSVRIEAEKDEVVVHVTEPTAAVKEEKPLVAEKFPQVAINRNADVSEGRWLGRFLFLSVLVIAGVFGTNFLKGGMVNKVVDDGSEKVVVNDQVEAPNTDAVQVADTEVAGTEVAGTEVEAPVEPEVIEVDGDLADDAAIIEAEAKLDAAQAEQVAKNEEQKETVPAKELTTEDVLIQAFNRSNVYVPNKKEYAAKIAKQTENTSVSPLVVSAVAMAESYLSPKAVSKNGEKKGLMQISADKEAYIQGLQGKKAEAGDLLDADYNLGLGVWYLDYLNKKYEGNLSKVLYAYSNGEDNLQRVLDGKESAPKYTGRHFANLQRYYNALAEKGTERLVLSLPVAELKPAEEKKEEVVDTLEQPVPGKADVEMAKSAVIVDDPERVPYSDEWVKSIMGMKLKATAQEKAEIVSIIKEQSLIYDMDPAYIASVVMAESAFNSKAVSKRGKRGLFQFEPQWARVVAATLGMKWQGEDALFDPAYNIELGTAYLQHLSLLFDNDFEKSAIAFSLTPTLVARILAGKKAMPSYVPLYVRNVSRYCDKWGCKTKVGESYAERLSKVKLRK